MIRKAPKPALRQLATAACAGLLCVQYAMSALAATELPGAEAPDFVLKSVSGANLRLSEYRGEVVVVSFWATWCGDCRALLAELNEWHEVYASVGLRLLAVGLDRDPAEVREVSQSLGLAYPIVHDADLEVSRRYGVDEMPVAVLIDRDGIVRDVVAGFRRTEGQALLDRVRDLLRE